MRRRSREDLQPLPEALPVSDGRILILDPAYGLKYVRLAAAIIQHTPEAGAIGQFAEHAILTND
jgi:hypothetical protein